MLKSMTAYGRANIVSPIGRLAVEIYSVNRKHLEINTMLPKEFLRYDADIKKKVATVVGRGQVNVKISACFDQSPCAILPNMPVIKQIKEAWEIIAKELDLPLGSSTMLEILAKETNLFLYEDKAQDEELYRTLLEDVVSKALEQLTAMKFREGLILYTDLQQRIKRLTECIREIAKQAPTATEKYRNRLTERLEEFFKGVEGNEELILREVCVYAEKIDIVEELVRFDAHLQQVNILFNSCQEGQGIGKTLEFLIQELNREINTIASKSSDALVSRFVIEIKSELERIREQIQNIE